MKKLLVSAMIAVLPMCAQASLVDHIEYSSNRLASIRFGCNSTGGVNMGIINERMKTENFSANPYNVENVLIHYTNDNLYGQPDQAIKAKFSNYYNMYVVENVSQELIDKMASPGLKIKVNFGYSNTTEYMFTSILYDMYGDTKSSCH